RSCDDAGNRFLELELADRLLVVAGGENRGLINKVARVGPGKTGRLPRQHFEVDLAVERLVARVSLENRAATADVGAIERHVPVEATRTKQRGIEDIRAVGG